MSKGRSLTQWCIGIVGLGLLFHAVLAAYAQTPEPLFLEPFDPVPAKPRAILLAQAASGGETKPKPVAVSQTPKPSFHDIQDRIASTTDTVLLARIDSTTATNHDLRRWLNVAKPTVYERYSVDQILALPGRELAAVISSMGFYQMAREESLKESDFVSTPLPSALRNEKHNVLRTRFFEKEVNEKHKPMGEEEARRYYRQNLGDYTEPLRFMARAIFLSTYRPYTLKTGDTLNAIAATQIGSSKTIGRILDRATSTPVFRPLDPRAVEYVLNPGRGGPPPPSFEEVQFLPPLRPDVVMVPMRSAERQGVRRRMEQIAEQLRSGTDFVELATTHSDEPQKRRGQLIGPLPSPGRPLLPSVIDAVLQTPVGGITPILDTPHGFLILRIETKTEEFVRPYEAVRSELLDKELEARRQRARQELERAVFRDPILTIEDAIMENNAPNDRVIARVGDFAYTWGDFRHDTGRRRSAPPSRSDRVNLLAERAVVLREAIIAAKARAMGLEREPDVAARLDAVNMMLRGRAYLVWYADSRVRPSDAKLREFYEQERDQFRKPGQYRLIELTLRLEEDQAKDPREVQAMMNYLRDHVADRARSYRQFSRLARAEGRWPLLESERGQSMWVEENYRGEAFAKELVKMKKDQVSGPFHVENDVLLVWLRDRRDPPQPSFQEVRSAVERLYRRQKRMDLLTAAEEEIRARHSLEYLFEFDEQ